MLNRSGGEVRINAAPLKPYESNIQGYRGDLRPVASNVQCSIRLPGSRTVGMTELLEYLRDTRIVQMDEFSLRLAGVVGITSWSPLGLAETRVELEFISGPAFFADDVLRFINGEIWEFRPAP